MHSMKIVPLQRTMSLIKAADRFRVHEIRGVKKIVLY